MKFDVKPVNFDHSEKLKEFKRTYKFLRETKKLGVSILARLDLNLLSSNNSSSKNYIINDEALDAYAKSTGINFLDLLRSNFIKPQSSVLDLGGNFGYFSMALAERLDCECYVLDSDPFVIELGKLIKQDWFDLSKERLDIKYLCGDAFKLSLKDSVDYTIISNVFSSFRKDLDFGDSHGLITLPLLSPSILKNSKNLIIHLPRKNEPLVRTYEYYEKQIEDIIHTWKIAKPQRIKNWIVFYNPRALIVR